MKTKYVVGFLFNDDFSQVALIRKNKPAFQAGLLNGVGGKVEESDETAWHAMVREFGEETDCKGLTGWNPFCSMMGMNNDGSQFHIDFFWNSGYPLNNLKSPESEKIEIHSVSEITSGIQKTLGNVPWLVAMAKDFAKGVYPPQIVIAQY